MSVSTKSSTSSAKKSITSERSEQCCNQILTAADCKASIPSLKASIHGTSSSKDLDVVKKLMEWWYLAPLLFAVLMFLLVGTVFEKRIETAVRGFLDRYLSPSRDGEQQTLVATAQVQDTSSAPAAAATPQAPKDANTPIEKTETPAT